MYRKNYYSEKAKNNYMTIVTAYVKKVVEIFEYPSGKVKSTFEVEKMEQNGKIISDKIITCIHWNYFYGIPGDKVTMKGFFTKPAPAAANRSVTGSCSSQAPVTPAAANKKFIADSCRLYPHPQSNTG